MSEYKIEIRRLDTSICEGKLTFFVNDNLVLETTCWEEPAKLVSTNTYTGCSATLMAKKQKIGIYLPDDQTNRNGIFIHSGEGPDWSEGCIIISEDDIQEIHNSITQKDAQNIVVSIT